MRLAGPSVGRSSSCGAVLPTKWTQSQAPRKFDAYSEGEAIIETHHRTEPAAPAPP